MDNILVGWWVDNDTNVNNKFEMAKCKCYTPLSNSLRGLILSIYPLSSVISCNIGISDTSAC